MYCGLAADEHLGRGAQASPEPVRGFGGRSEGIGRFSSLGNYMTSLKW